MVPAVGPLTISTRILRERNLTVVFDAGAVRVPSTIAEE
jgi:hypothetical protein